MNEIAFSESQIDENNKSNAVVNPRADSNQEHSENYEYDNTTDPLNSTNNNSYIAGNILEHTEVNAAISDMLEELLSTGNDNSVINNSNNSNINTPMHPQQVRLNAAPRAVTGSFPTEIKEIYNKLSFGRTKEIDPEPKKDVYALSQLNEATLPFTIKISGLSSISRVENQMKLQLSLQKNPLAALNSLANPLFVHLPTNTLAKEKLYLNEKDENLQSLPEEFKKRVLFLDAILLSDPNNKITHVCNKCVLREKKRYSRRKSGVCDNILWCNNLDRNAILFSNRQLFPIHHFTKVNNDKTPMYNGTGTNGINFELKTRITCYCKHHPDAKGFKFLFVIRDYQGNIISKTISDPTMIMGRKRELPALSNENDTKSVATKAQSVPVNFVTPKNSMSESPMADLHLGQPIQIIRDNSHLPSPSASSQSDDNTFDNIKPQDLQFQQNMAYNNVNSNTPNQQKSLNNNLVSEGYYDLLHNQNMNSDLNLQNFNMNNKIDVGDNSLNSNDFEIRKRSKHNYEMNPSIHSPHTTSSISSSTNNSNHNYNMGNQLQQQQPMTIQNSNHYSQLRNDAFSSSFSSLPTLIPSISRVIPSQGPISGGIEITLLGSNFKPGQIIEFGANMALSTQCWNSTTMVTFLPPASKAEQVIVTVRDPDSRDLNGVNGAGNNNSNGSGSDNGNMRNGPVFTYIDDSDKQLIELALQIVGLKMNGKLDDPRNVARQIVDSTNQTSPYNSNTTTPNGNMQGYKYSHCRGSSENYGQTDTEILLIDIINGTKGFNCTLTDEMGRTILHYACLKGYKALSKLLVQKTSHGLCQREDIYGFLPVHFAAINGDPDVINIVDGFNSSSMTKTQNGFTARDLYVINHANDDMKDSESDWSCDSSSYDEDDLGVHRNADIGNSNFSNKEDLQGSEQEQDETNKSLWNRMMNRLNDDILPKYEDLFPKEYLDYSMNTKLGELINNNEQAQSASLTIESSLSAGVSDNEEDDDEEEQEQEYFENILLYQRDVNLKNDKMLLYFWLPVLVFLSSAMILYVLGNKDDWLHYINDAISKFIRIMLTKIFVGRENMSISIKHHLSNFQPSKILKDFPKSIEYKMHA